MFKARQGVLCVKYLPYGLWGEIALASCCCCWCVCVFVANVTMQSHTRETSKCTHASYKSHAHTSEMCIKLPSGAVCRGYVIHDTFGGLVLPRRDRDLVRFRLWQGFCVYDSFILQAIKIGLDGADLTAFCFRWIV